MAKKKENVEIIKDASENAIFNKETEGLSQGQIVLRRFIRHRAAMISVVVLFTLITVVYTALDWRIGDEDDPFIIPGWWQYGFEDMPELRYGADCIATCASNVSGYGVMQKSSTGNSVSSCEKTGNVALGVGYQSHSMAGGYDDCPYGRILDPTTCLCHYALAIDCYCICGT